MSSRELWVVIGARVQGLMAGLAKAQAGVREFDRELQKSADRRHALEDIGTSYRNVALAAAAGVGVVTKVAADWESDFAGVNKTVGGTAQEMSDLEDQLRQMARTMPATHEEIAATAQAAGALGVEKQNISDFTKTMIQLGEATDDLTPDQAATDMAQFMNVMRTAPKNVDNLASSLVALGNNGASTEGQILQMAQNIAGAGKTVGLTETDVLGVANALASAGIEAEAGGTAVSNIFMDMAKSAKTNSKELRVWAETSNLTIDEFKKGMAEDPAQVFARFTKGLGRVNKEGGNVYKLLEDLGQSDVRVTRALLSMANSGDMLTDSLELSKQAFADNTALAKEYGTRSQTAAAQAQVAWNGVKDNLIDIGHDTLPIVKELSGDVSELTGAFSDLPAPVKSSVLQLLLMTATLAGGLYAVTKARTGLASLADAYETSGKAAQGAGRRYAMTRSAAGAAGLGLLAFSDQLGKVDPALGAVSTALGGAAVGFAVGGPWGAAVGGGIGIIKAFADANKHAVPDVDALTASLDKQTGAITANSREMINAKLQEDGAFKQGRSLGIDPGIISDAALGNKDAIARIKAIRDAAANQAAAVAEAQSPGSGRSQASGIKSNFDHLLASIGAQNSRLAEAREQWENLTDAQKQSREANALSEQQIRAVTKAVDKMPRKVATQFTTTGYEKAVENAAKVARQAKMTPKEVKTALKALDYSSDQIRAVLRLMHQADKTEAYLKVFTNADSALKSLQSVTNSMGFLAGMGPINLALAVTRTVTDRRSTAQADGGILEMYADGGLRENHVAQIGRGTTRIWNEPETGGEAYIPLAPSKRSRSLEIWAEAGRKMGVAGYANGGIAGGGAARGMAGTSVTARLVSNRVEVGGDGLARLIDDRVEIHFEEQGRVARRDGRAGRD